MILIETLHKNLKIDQQIVTSTSNRISGHYKFCDVIKFSNIRIYFMIIYKLIIMKVSKI